MKQLFILIFALIIGFPSFSQSEKNDKTTSYYFIRHAEKDRSEKGVKDPHLTEKGLLRAQNWAKTLKHISFDAVYSTDYHRTKETAQPVANNNRLELTIYNPNNLNIDKFKEETKGKTVLIVGHSNTTPMLVNKILSIQKYKQIEGTNNSNLYIVYNNNGDLFDMLLVFD